MTDADLLLDLPDPEYGSGVIGICDVCGKRQAVIVLSRERFKLCVIDFLNKSWVGSAAAPGAPLPPYRSERIFFPTTATKIGKAPAVLLKPTRLVRHAAILVTPEVHGLTTSVLDGAIRLAREGYEVLLPDIDRSAVVGPADHLALRWGARGAGVSARSPGVVRLTRLYTDALAYLREVPMVDPEKSAVVGLSYGATLALLLATEEQKLSALVLAYPAPVRPAALAGLVTTPTLLVAGTKDPLAQKAKEQLTLGMSSGLLEVYDAGAVGHHFLARDLSAYRMEAAEAAWTAVTAFLRGRLMPPPPKPPAPPAKVAPPAPAIATPATPPATAAASG